MVNVGKANGFFPGNLMELVNKNVNGPKPNIGRIDLLPGYTLFDVRKEDAHRVLDALRHADFFGDKIHAEIATDKDYAAEAGGSRRGGKRGGKEKPESRSSRGGRRERSFDKEKKDKKSAVAKKDKKVKKEKKEKKDRKDKKNKPGYNGSYEIFYK